MFPLVSCTMANVTSTDWKRVADHVIARRVELGMKTTTALAERAKLTARALGDVENARRTNYTQGTKAQIEHALNWVYGSIDDILAGGQPSVADATDSTTPDEYLANGDDLGRQSLQDLILAYGQSRDLPPLERVDVMVKALRLSIHAVRMILLRDEERTVRANAIDALNPADAALTFLQQDLDEIRGDDYVLETAPQSHASPQGREDQEVESLHDSQHPDSIVAAAIEAGLGESVSLKESNDRHQKRG